MKFVKRFLLLLISSLLIAAVSLEQARAVDITPPPPASQSAPSVFISAFGASDSLDFVELYNQSSSPINITDWKINYDLGCGKASAEINASGYLRGKDYFAFQPNVTSCALPQLTNLELVNDSGKIIQTVDLSSAQVSLGWQHYQRTNSPNSTRLLTGNFAIDYKPIKADFVAYSDPLYNPPSDTGGLQIVEILPHSTSCSPLDASPLCNDYLKIYNSSNQSLASATYSLAYKSTSSNTIHSIDLLAPLAPGDYALVSTDNDANPISLTDAGGYVWLQDIGGVKIYEAVVQYPSASADSKIGEAYALAGDGSWQWTTTPNPMGANIITAEPAVISSASSSGSNLKPCADNQYRNPDSNRCNTILTAQSLVECLPTQYRNPATNRCNNLASTSSALQPCAANQERNPATNRCKAIVSTASSLTPCQPGWTRNPDTNRCRKTSNVKGADTIKDVKSPASISRTGWIVAAIALAAALGYAAYEWRQEILDNFRKLKLRR